MPTTEKDTKHYTKPWENYAELLKALQDVDQQTGRPVVFLDFEFNGMAEQKINLVCVTLMGSRENALGLFEAPGECREIWLHNSEEGKTELADLLEDLRAEGTILGAYAAAAEARSIMALGMDPHLFQWVDLFADWRQLTFNNDSCRYGTHFSATGYPLHSVAPHFDSKRNKGRNNKEVGLGLVGCVGQMFKVFIDAEHKTQMRDLIISAPAEFTPEEKKAIQDYCTTDVQPLGHVYAEQTRRLMRATGMNAAQVLEARLKRGAFMVSGAKMEAEGFPLDIEATKNLRTNFAQAREDIITDLVQNYYPFYERGPAPGPKSPGIRGEWVEKYENFVRFLEENHPDLIKNWPKVIHAETKKPSYLLSADGTKTAKLSRKDDDLEAFDGIPEIYAYRQAKKNIKQLTWFKEPDENKKKKDGDFFDNVGADGRLRAFLGSYGTQTSRNAPKASRFILAMSNWLRCLIKPPKGWAIIAIDYASQEFAIAAVMSKDRSMVAAYRSGDPYLYFAKKAGAVPQNADPKRCKTPSLVLLDKAKEVDKDLDVKGFFAHGCPADVQKLIQDRFPEVWAEYKQHQEFERQRNLFKATTLGLQYGMGAEKLAAKLSSDMGEKITEEQARKLIALHKKTYPTYWNWLDQITKKYERNGCLILRDGWALLGDNSNSLSVRNFPVQGTGAVIMREAVRMLHGLGVKILAPLHDALYTICRVEDIEKTKEVQAKCMLDAVELILGNELKIRLDIDVHEHEDTWLEFKGRKFYGMLSKYLEKRGTVEDRVRHLKETIFNY